MFLEFLYSGHIQMDSLSTDQLTELLTLADRYEVLICYFDIFLKRKKDKFCYVEFSCTFQSAMNQATFSGILWSLIIYLTEKAAIF